MMIVKKQITTTPMELIKSTAVFLYFILMIFQNVYAAAVINYLWYAILFFCFVLGAFNAIRAYKQYRLFPYIVVYLVSLAANILFVGNSSLRDLVFTLIYFGLFFLLEDDDVSENFIAAAVYINSIALSVFLFRADLGKPIFVELSNNYVSVMLLTATSVYYARREYYKKPVSVLPAFACCFPCLFATGRGGIIAAFALLFFIVFYHIFLRKDWKRSREYILTCLGLVLLIALLIPFIPLIAHNASVEGALSRFSTLGMYGTGRMGIWGEYIEHMLSSFKKTLFGVNYSELKQMIRYKNNLHNSFLNLHASYGLVFVLFVIGQIYKNCLLCIKEKKWVYISVMTVFFFRALTDKFFAGALVGTPAFLFLLFYCTKGRKKPQTRRLLIQEN